jgi:hypothetical protein
MIVLKELNETVMWLEVIAKAQLLPNAEIVAVISEKRELCRILTAAVKSRASSNKQLGQSGSRAFCGFLNVLVECRMSDERCTRQCKRKCPSYGSGTRSYNGMLLSVNKRMSRNYSLTANYTWAHCIGHPVNNLLQGTAGAGVFNDPSNRNYDRGNCGDQDVRHIANATAVVSMPGFADPWIQRLAGNWRLSGILRAQSGEHLSPVVTADQRRTGVNVRSQRADVVSLDVYGNQCKSDLRSQNPSCRWFNSAAFATPAVGGFGNARAGSLVGAGNWSIDAGLSRTFDVTEGQRLEFRAEANNVLNHTNFANPATSLGATSGYYIAGADDPRIMQFAVKYIF